MAYNFYGWEGANISPIKKINKINNPRDLYDALSNIWCEYSCAPRLRVKWSKENKTVGQCSTTAFLVQDLFGGKVYGIKLDDGAFHCYNVVGDCVFDLTSEQFGDEAKNLVYENNEEQFREVHFANKEKEERYNYLKEELNKYINS